MKPMNKFALLSISFVLTTAYAINPGIPQMMEHFPHQTEAQIQILATVPAFSVMIIVLLSNEVTKLIGNKRTVQLGLLLAGIFGPLPIFLNNYYLILASRVLLGVGFGLINSLAVSLISYFFSGTEEASMMGLRSASESIGQSLLTLFAGYLISWGGWRYSFLVYLIAIPILILFTVYVPKVDGDDDEETARKETSKSQLNASVIFYAIALFIVVGSYVGIRVRIPLIMEQRGLGTEVASSQVLSMIPFLGLIIGVVFGKVYELFKKYLLMTGAILMAVGYLIIGLATSYGLVFLGGFIVGVGYPLIISGTFTFVSTFAPKGSETFATSIILFGINMGSFLSPYLLQWIDALTQSTSLVTPFYVYAVLLIIFGVLSYINLQKVNNQQLNYNQ